MAYQYGLFEKPMVNWELARENAAQRCGAWGYSNAQAFGATFTKCVAVNANGGCIEWQVTANFQCTN
jgi:hypothetical protein